MAAYVEMGFSSTSLPSLDFVNLWMAFRPGDLVYLSGPPPLNRSPRLVEFKSMDMSCICDHPWCVPSHKWRIYGFYIDYDGTSFGYSREDSTIRHFEGYKALKELDVLPLRFHPDEKAIRKQLAFRGRRFAKLHGRHYRYYKGVATVLGKDRNITLFGEEDEFPLQSTWVHIPGR
jgi:hypothetical protein